MNALSGSELEARELLVDQASTDDFVQLIQIAGLDPKKHLRFADWSGVDFSGCDLRGFDFTGARLRNCNFEGALVEGARFDQAEINGANLRKAADWKAYVKSWALPAKPVRDDHLPPGAVFMDAPFGPELVVFPAGTFMMGSNLNNQGPEHEVTIPHPVAVGLFAVTVEEWSAAFDDRGVKRYPTGSGTFPERWRYPAVQVSWYDAKAYVKWLSHKTGKRYRLLSEAEWEYICRAKATERSMRWPEPDSLDLYRIAEWCEDCWNADYLGKPESLRQTGGAWAVGDTSLRVVRGRVVNAPGWRTRYVPNNRSFSLGFRVARALMI